MATDDDDIQVGDIGTVFEVTVTEGGVVVDISTSTSRTIKFKKPSGTVVSQTATLSTDGTDGKMRYASVSGDIDQIGHWEFQGYVDMPSWSGHTEIGEFEVKENL